MSDIDRVLRSNLKLRHLQLLVALDEFRHIGRAAEFLSLTQPAISKMLAEIERMFGLALFVRSTRGTEPTAYGDAVIRFARSVLADYSRTQDEISAVSRGAAGRVSVGAMVVATPNLLVNGIERFKARSPNSSVLVEEGDLKRLLPRLRMGELDLFVGRLEPGYAAPDLETEALFDERMCVVVPESHPVADMADPQWADLAREAWVVPPPWASSRIKLNQMFYRHGLNPPEDVIETASFLMILTFMQRRRAVGYLALGVAQHFAQMGLVKVLPLELPMELPPVGMITMRGRLTTPTCLQLMECLRSVTESPSATEPWAR